MYFTGSHHQRWPKKPLSSHSFVAGIDVEHQVEDSPFAPSRHGLESQNNSWSLIYSPEFCMYSCVKPRLRDFQSYYCDIISNSICLLMRGEGLTVSHKFLRIQLRYWYGHRQQQPTRWEGSERQKELGWVRFGTWPSHPSHHITWAFKSVCSFCQQVVRSSHDEYG